MPNLTDTFRRLLLPCLALWCGLGIPSELQAQGCGSLKPVACENSKPGNPASEWDISGVGDSSIQGFATDISVNRGQTVRFKIDTNASNYHLDIYRMGYYGGMGARKVTVTSVLPSATLPQNQPDCLSNSATGLVDCGNWAESASWQVPADATSGIYFAKLVRPDTNGASHIFFIVRDDTGQSDILFQTSDTTWQAYNRYGGNSLYVGSPAGRAYKVSYNRPFTTRDYAPEDWFFNAEYPMVRWLEANGYDVSYSTGVDSDRRGVEILEHKVFLSVGHDEYWSSAQRTNVEAARAAGVHLAFFSGNEVFWKTRWENSIDASGTPHRTLVCYKETHANAKIDPNPEWTGTWRDPRFSPPADGGRPENALTGTIFLVNDTGTPYSIEVPESYGKLRLWRNTTVATLPPGGSATLPLGTLGYEWDVDLDNGFRPKGLVRLSSTTLDVPSILLDNGSTYGPGTATHNLTLYRHAPNGALVFGAGTIQWSWGLDVNHDRVGPTTPSTAMRQATVNLLADMGVQPETLQPGLTPATTSSDTVAPTSSITFPAAGSNLAAGNSVTITGIATESAGGIVAGVEVSVNGGATWHPAVGLENWSYVWTPTGSGSVTILSRATDDSANIEVPSAGVTVTIGSSGGQTCPCSIWNPTATPAVVSDPDASAVELGVKFLSDVNGSITGIRFYKGTANTGTHVGKLWSSSGTLLASATFVNETASGWQQVLFSSPVAITANTTYVASYHTNVGRYSVDEPYFASTGVDNAPLHALANGVNGPNGVYLYGSGGFPNQSFNSSNYWVDVVFNTGVGPDSTPPVVSSTVPANTASGVSVGTTVTAVFSEAMDSATISTSTVELRDPSNLIVPATVNYSSATTSAILTPTSPLAGSTTYTATVKGGATDPRVKDVAGNALATNFSWSFTTAAAPPSPPDQGPGGPILVVSSPSNPFNRYYAEILRAEGLNAFAVADIGTLSASSLLPYDVVILGEMALTDAQATMFSNWVSSGGNLIAMRPDKKLAGLLGLSDAAATLSNAYLLVNTSTPPGSGIVNQTVQFHGIADRYNLSGAASLATLYSDASTATTNPAVTLRSVGTSGGQAAAFTFDLARSIVYTRQGNPAWSGQERDGATPIRPDDLFWVNDGSDPQANWINLNKVAVPQADEQQRFLANLIGHINQDRKPLPRFWYFPKGKKAVVIMTGDDHATGGTAGRFDQHKASSPAGCSVADWECVRSTSYVYTNSPLTNAQAAAYTADGFEVGLHVTTNCSDYTPTSLVSFYANQLATWSSQYSSLSSPVTNRTHCIAWSDFDTQPQIELNHGIRLDTNYYYWPPVWAAGRPGFFTGSGMPMRFTSAAGNMIDVYQATTQMTDESGQAFPFTVDALLDKAVGPEGYYGAFTANMHTDFNPSSGSDAIVASALDRGVPVVSARQMLQWLDGRNNSSFASITWNANVLSFSVTAASGSNGLQGMVPTVTPVGTLSSITRGGSAISYTSQLIKGVQYAFFTATPGDYQVSYIAGANPAPITSGLTPSSTTAGGGGFTLTIDGSNFIAGSVVRWNGSNRSTAFDSATRVTATIPSTDIVNSGTAQVTVFNPAPGGGTSNTQTFTIQAPTVSLLSDDFADGEADGWTISPLGNATGWSVVSGAYRYDGGGHTQSYRGDPAWADYSLEVKVRLSTLSNYPGGIRGRVDPATGTSYAVWLYPGDSQIKLFRATAWNIDNPGLAQLGIASGIAFTTSSFHTLRVTFQGSSIQVFYDGALIISASDSAYINGVIALDVSNQIIEFDDVSVTGEGSGGSPVPTTTSLNPNSATQGGTAFTLTVNGANFVSNSVVRWNGSDRPTTFASATQLTAAIPATDITTAGTAQVTAFNPAPGGGISNAQTFTISAASNPVPTTTGLSPTSAIAGGPAFTLTVNGTNFVSSSVVRWNGSDRPTTFVSSTQLTADIPTTDITTAGTAQVTVSNPVPGGGISNAQTFTINAANPVPTTTSMSPTSAIAGGPGFTLTVNGTNFVTTSLVRWNGSDRPTTYVSATRLTAAIPAPDIAAGGTAQVTVLNPSPGGGNSNARTFTINNPAPTTSSLSPSSTTTGGPAFTLTVNGTNFVPTSVVRWNGSNRTTTHVSSTQLTASITAADIAQGGTATIRVFNPAPAGGTSNAQTFTTSNPLPAITNISPPSTTAGGPGLTLTVVGTGFVPNSRVRWNGSNRTTTFVSSTQITAAITANDIASGRTANITVFNPTPGGGTSNAQVFTVFNPVPAITSINPTSTQAGGPSFTLTVVGTGFVPTSRVRWNGSNRTTSFVSSTQLTATITSANISSAGTAAVTVFNPTPGGGTSNTQTFTKTP